MLQFLTGAPLWVWPLLALLIFVGIRSARQRTAPILMVYLMPLLGLITVRSVMAFPDPLVAWGLFLLGYVGGVLTGLKLQGNWLLDKMGRSVLLAGEWFTLAVMMILFISNFVNGAVQAVNPDLYASASFIATFSMIVGWAGGTFLGRALHVARA